MEASFEVKETVSMDSESMRVVCDENNSRLRSFVEKMESFYQELDEDERTFLREAATAADIEELRRGEGLLESVGAFEGQIREISVESDFEPTASTYPCVLSVTRATAYVRC